MSAFVLKDGSVVCPLCRNIRHNMALMIKHLEFWHDLTPPNRKRVQTVIETGAPLEITVRRDGTRQRLYVEMPLPGF
jgi:hypothetical protein